MKLDDSGRRALSEAEEQGMFDIETDESCQEPCNSPIRRIRRAVNATFQNLDRYPYLADADREEFRKYHRFFLEALEKIDRKIQSGKLCPVDMGAFPDGSAFRRGTVRAGLFIGSFDPFQMTHLATALRFLSSPASNADVLFVIPEGAENSAKPNLSEYDYRIELIQRQIRRVFRPLIVPLDIGRGEGTIGIVEKFIRMFPGAQIDVTHVLGSDVLLWAYRLLAEDLVIWNEAARENGVTFGYDLFVIRRGREHSSRQIAQELRKSGIPVYLDAKVIGAPSSTDFRDRHALTIIFPTDEILKHMEFAFRYRLNKSWPGWPDLS